METLKKIVVIDKDEEMGSKVKKMIDEWKDNEFEMIFNSGIVIEDIRRAYCVIIDIRLIKDINEFVEILKSLFVEKIIFVTNELNHKMTPDIINSGAQVFYKYSPIAILINKISETWIEHK